MSATTAVSTWFPKWKQAVFLFAKRAKPLPRSHALSAPAKYWQNRCNSLYAKCSHPHHLPCQAIALAAVESEISHLTVLDVHPRLSHVASRPSIACLAAVCDDLRDGADVRPAIVFVFVGGVLGGIPGEYLICDGGTSTRYEHF